MKTNLNFNDNASQSSAIVRDTTFTRKEKPKVTYRQVINKTLVTILMATTILGASAGLTGNAHAADIPQETEIVSLYAAEDVKPVTLTDVKTSDWFYTDVTTLVGRGAINGYNDKTFKADNNISLGQFLKIATCLLYPDETASIEKPAEGINWASPYYQLAVSKGLIDGTYFKATTAALDGTLTREDMSQILVSIASARGETLTINSKAQSSIKDFSTISQSRQDAVLKAYSVGLLQGDNLRNFAPKASLTRGQTAAVICRAFNFTTRPTPNFTTPSGGSTVLDSSVVYTEGDCVGWMKDAVATEYDFAALKSAKFYSESCKRYVSVTLPELPSGFKWSISVDAYTADGCYVFATANDAYANVSGTVVVEVKSGYADKTLKDIDVATLSVRITNANNKGGVSHKISTKAPNQVYQYDSELAENSMWKTFDTTGIFNW